MWAQIVRIVWCAIQFHVVFSFHVICIAHRNEDYELIVSQFYSWKSQQQSELYQVHRLHPLCASYAFFFFTSKFKTISVVEGHLFRSWITSPGAIELSEFCGERIQSRDQVLRLKVQCGVMDRICVRRLLPLACLPDLCGFRRCEARACAPQCAFTRAYEGGGGTPGYSRLPTADSLRACSAFGSCIVSRGSRTFSTPTEWNGRASSSYVPLTTSSLFTGHGLVLGRDGPLIVFHASFRRRDCTRRRRLGENPQSLNSITNRTCLSLRFRSMLMYPSDGPRKACRRPTRAS